MNTTRNTIRRPARARGLSMVEMLIALSISASLLTATLAALDSMFKGYKQTTESASTHVITRIVVTRVLSMIRTGTDFGPGPASVLNTQQNPIAADYIQFVSARDDDGDAVQITRIEFRDSAGEPTNRDWGAAGGPPAPDPDDPPAAGAGELWYVLMDSSSTVIDQRPLLSGVRNVVFTMQYEIGPKLTHASMDITVEPNDSRDLTIGADQVAQTFRIVASSAPRVSNDQ